MTDYDTPALERWRHYSDVPLLILAVGSLPLLLLELVRTDLTRSDRVFLDVVNVVVLIAFLIDYVVELWLARPRGRYVRAEWTSLLIVVAQALALAPGLTGFGALRVLRAGRVWRFVAVVARLAAVSGAVAADGKRMLRRHAAGFALGVAGLTWLTSAVGFTLAEDVGAGGRLDSFFDALWWSSATITTVGYGDVYPVTAAGRMIGCSPWSSASRRSRSSRPRWPRFSSEPVTPDPLQGRATLSTGSLRISGTWPGRDPAGAGAAS